jgi:hypothetical protein
VLVDEHINLNGAHVRIYDDYCLSKEESIKLLERVRDKVQPKLVAKMVRRMEEEKKNGTEK